MNVCGCLPITIQQYVGDFGFGHNICGFEASSLTMVLVKWLNTTRSWSGEPELTEGTWLQLMCCAPSRSRCPKFQSNGVHGVHEGILEYSGGDGEDGVD